jgi:hypothetical protein
MSRGRIRRKSVTLRFSNPCIGFSTPPSMSRGRDLRHERGKGSARHVADDCLKYLFNLKKYKERKYIVGF